MSARKSAYVCIGDGVSPKAGGRLEKACQRADSLGYSLVAVGAGAKAALSLFEKRGKIICHEALATASSALGSLASTGTLVFASAGTVFDGPLSCVGQHAFIRASAMQYNRMVVLVDPTDYSWVLDRVEKVSSSSSSSSSDIPLTLVERRVLASKALRHMAAFDMATAERFHAVEEEKRAVLVIGSGGREHAIAWKLARSKRVSEVFVGPGNGGTDCPATAESCPIRNVPELSYANEAGLDGIVSFALKHRVSMVAVGPEAPLVDGLCDKLAASGIRSFGPSKAAAQLEASKAFSKDFMKRNGIPTAQYENFTDLEAALAHVRAVKYPIVIKASGLAAGKGVVLPESLDEALESVREMMAGGKFGSAGSEIVIEERLTGPEVSCLAFSDGVTVVPMPGAQDHKRVGDGDIGLNTGGMGAYAPAPVLSPELAEEIREKVLQRTVDAMRAEGCPYTGVLYAGMMLTPSGPKCLEFNCRFGDPETQVLLPLLESDLLDAMEACSPRPTSLVETKDEAWPQPHQAPGSLEASDSLGGLRFADVRFATAAAAVTVVAASGGYPVKYKKGMEIIGTEAATRAGGIGPQRVTVFHAGTKRPNGNKKLVTSGGRVLAVTAVDREGALRMAVRAAYRGLSCISFDGMIHRTDIAAKALPSVSGDGSCGAYADDGTKKAAKAVRLGVLGSTRGTDLQAILDAIKAGELPGVSVATVVSNRSKSGILERARTSGIVSRVAAVSAKGCASRAEFDAKVTAELEKDGGVDLVLMIGYMRIVSDEFCARWRNRLLNVHPSLLPAFAGGMDTDVHAAVLASGAKSTGCTVHHVTPEVDGGMHVLQRACDVEVRDTPATLKARVQAMEGDAFVEVIRRFQDGTMATMPLEDGANSAKAAAGIPSQLTYAAAGVDIDAGETLIEMIKPFCKRTRRPGCDASLGGFGGVFDLAAAKAGGAGSDAPLLVACTDGVGTKLKVAGLADVHGTVGIDLVAMSVNDLIVQGAEPLFFLDYFACGKLETAVAAEVIKGVALGCEDANCGLIGGETAEMPSMYPDGEYDLAGFAVGAVRRSKLLPTKDIGAGDVLLALPSSGVHSNGFSLVRKVVEKAGLAYSDPAPFTVPNGTTDGKPTLGEALLIPTRIYVRQLLPLMDAGMLKGLAHITGGGLTENLPRILPEGTAAAVKAGSWPVLDVFRWIKEAGNVPEDDMIRTFNMGVGMVLIVDAAKEAEVRAALAKVGEEAYAIGSIVELGEGTKTVQYGGKFFE